MTGTGKVSVKNKQGDSVNEENVICLECNIDDMNPEFYPALLDALFQAGAVDAWLVPIIMKKGRPAVTVKALCFSDSLSALKDAVFTHSTTLGVRWFPASREYLSRETVSVETEFGMVRVKQAVAEDGSMALKFAPELVDCEKLAASADVSVETVYRAALVAHENNRKRA